VQVKSDTPRLKARQYVEQLASAGRYTFIGREAQAPLGVSAKAAALALNRLAKQGLLASPARGLYVIVPPEYRSLGCLPPEQFIPDLMKRLKRPYYVGLLSAAEYHGAAHQRPQALQVFLETVRRPIICGRVRVMFMARKRLGAVPVQTVNTPRGGLAISTPESTAVDLVGYEQQAGGLNLVATVLSELAERIEPAKLVVAADAAPIVWAQRLGYLLDYVGSTAKTDPLLEYVRAHVRNTTPLAPGRAFKNSPRDAKWKVYVNAAVETDL
jgi:predicted transcriptional regulator of viral defense system